MTDRKPTTPDHMWTGSADPYTCTKTGLVARPHKAFEWQTDRWGKAPLKMPGMWTHRRYHVPDHRALVALLGAAETLGTLALISGDYQGPAGTFDRRQAVPHWQTPAKHLYHDVPTNWLVVDVDSTGVVCTPEEAPDELDAYLQRTPLGSCHYTAHLSNSACIGQPGGKGPLKAHVFVRTSVPLTIAQQHRWATLANAEWKAQGNNGDVFDVAVYSPAHLLYVARPTFTRNGVPVADPVGMRVWACDAGGATLQPPSSVLDAPERGSAPGMPRVPWTPRNATVCTNPNILAWTRRKLHGTPDGDRHNRAKSVYGQLHYRIRDDGWDRDECADAFRIVLDEIGLPDESERWSDRLRYS